MKEFKNGDAVGFLEVEKNKLEIKNKRLTILISVLTILTIITPIISSIYWKINSIFDDSKLNKLAPHTSQKISFPPGKSVVEFWHKPDGDKNQGIKLRIEKNQFVFIQASHDVKASILDSEGNYITMVSLRDLYWVLQVPKNDEYTFVFRGKNKTLIQIIIPLGFDEGDVYRIP